MSRHHTLPLAALAVVLVSAVTPGFSSATFTASSASSGVIRSGTWAASCAGVDVQASLGDGRLGAGDTLAFTYTGQVRPASVLPGWTGNAHPVLVRFTADDRLSVHALAQPQPASSLGTVALNADFVKNQLDYADATLTADVIGSGSSARTVVTLRFGTEPPNQNGQTNQVSAPATMGWTLAAGVTDPAGAPCGTGAVTESGPADRDF